MRVVIVIRLLEVLYNICTLYSWVSLLPREVLEEAENYKEAQGILATRRLLAPVYYILAGPEPLQVSMIKYTSK